MTENSSNLSPTDIASNITVPQKVPSVNTSISERIYDEIKYLYKAATGKELTAIEKVKKEFDRAWKELEKKGAAEVVDANNKTQYNISHTADAKPDSVEYLPNHQNKKITADMNENEREDVLRNSFIKLSLYDGNNEDLNGKNVLILKSSYNSQAGKILKALGEKFGVFKSYSNENVSLDFDYPRVSLNESVHKQGNISTNFYDFAKMLYVFDDVVKNAVPIEVHTDKYKGTIRENPNLKYDYVLLSAFQDGEYIIPVEFHVKEMNDGAVLNNKLYVSVTLGKIKIENERIKAETSYPNGRTSTLPTTFSSISIADLVKKSTLNTEIFTNTFHLRS